jgi:hypothetical protein
MKFRPTCITMAYCSSVRYVFEPSWNKPSFCTSTVCKYSFDARIHPFDMDDSQVCEHSYRTHSSRGPTCLRFAGGIISAISKSRSSKVRCIREKALKKDDQKAYPEVAPHCPLSGYIHRIGCKSAVIPASGRRGGAIALSDLARVVHMDEVT